MYITFIGYAMLIALVFQALLLLVPPPKKKAMNSNYVLHSIQSHHSRQTFLWCSLFRNSTKNKSLLRELTRKKSIRGVEIIAQFPFFFWPKQERNCHLPPKRTFIVFRGVCMSIIRCWRSVAGSTKKKRRKKLGRSLFVPCADPEGLFGNWDHHRHHLVCSA
jgi:hypothetical protein